MRLIKYYIDNPPAAGSPPDPNAVAPVVAASPSAPVAAAPGLPAEGGGGNPPGAPPAPKGYTVTTPQERSDWNGFLDFASKQGGNVSDPKQQAALLGQYKKANPNFSITADRIPAIQYEAYQLRKGDSFGNLGAKELGYLRQGLSPNFLNADTSNVGKLYYPQEGSYGTDVENYYNSKFNPAAAKPLPAATAAPNTASSTAAVPAGPRPAGLIPLPDYNDPASRLNFAKNIVQQYGPLMHDRGDTFLRTNEVPQNGIDTAKNISIKAASAVGLDPALLYASAMEEGMSGRFADKDGNFKYEESGNKDYPVPGSAAYGLDTFVSRFPGLVAKGYLPASFKSQFIPYHPNDPNATQDSALYKTADAAMQAKAAFLKSNYDEIDEYAKQKNITLSPTARDFFALANFNAGKGVGFKMLDDYNRNGYLKNDAFMNGRPTKGEGLSGTSYGPTHDEKGNQTSEGVYTNVVRRIIAAKALKEQQLLK